MRNPLEYIRKVLNLKDESDELIASIFNNDLIIQKSRDNAFKKFFNDFKKSPRFLSMSCDYEFKKGIKGNPDSEIDQKFT